MNDVVTIIGLSGLGIILSLLSLVFAVLSLQKYLLKIAEYVARVYVELEGIKMWMGFLR